MARVRDLIDEAQSRHWAFPGQKTPPGAMLLYLNRKARELLLRAAQSIEPLVGEARTVASVIAGALVGDDGAGNPVFSTTETDGFPVFKDALGNPYFDFSGTPATTDPFGQSGGTPGWPLPANFVKVIAASVIYDQGRHAQLDIVMERQRHGEPGVRDLTAFVNGNRLVPCRIDTLGSGDGWDTVTAVSLSYVRFDKLTSLDGVLTVPEVLIGALVACLAEQLAVASKQVPPIEKRGFVDARKEAEDMLLAVADEILGDVRTDHVIIND